MTKETLKFGAEVDKIFQLVIHSLYENKEIFLRELISNASDACDKLRYKALTKPELLKENPDLKITIEADKDKKTLTITDSGIGMNRKEMVENLGTIARSGTQNFLSKLTGDAKKDNQLIGQFGVGFYSSFMIADKVIVISQAAGSKKAHLWSSKGDGNFSIEDTKETLGRGTKITLYLRDGEEEYLDKFRIKHIVETYSYHTAFDVVLKDGENGEILNEGLALWLKPKSEIKDTDYKEFYQSISGLGNDEPWMILHNKAEGIIEYTNLLFIPSIKPFDLFHPDRLPQVKLYAKRVFIAEEGISVVPSYLRFLRGVVDSEDIQLNISRETVQNNTIINKIRSSITKKILSELSKKAEKKPEEYQKFWENFGSVIKEGLCDGMEPREDILKACRFKSTNSDKLTSLKEYKERMKKDQNAIYYIIGNDEKSAGESPQLEGFREKGFEILLLTDSVDQFWVNIVNEYDGTPVKSVTRASTDLKEEEKKTDKKESSDKKYNDLITFIKTTLGENISDVQTTLRLKDSPVCLTVPDTSLDIRMERFMVENKQIASSSAKIFEINPNHVIIKKLAKDLKKKDAKKKLTDTVHLLFAQANIVEGEPIKDIKGFTKRLNTLLEKTLAA